MVKALRQLGYARKDGVNFTEWLRTKARETIKEAEQYGNIRP